MDPSIFPAACSFAADLAEGSIVIVGVVQLASASGDDASPAAVRCARCPDRVLAIVAPLVLRQKPFPVGKRFTVLRVGKGTAPRNEGQGLPGFGRQRFDRDFAAKRTDGKREREQGGEEFQSRPFTAAAGSSGGYADRAAASRARASGRRSGDPDRAASSEKRSRRESPRRPPSGSPAGRNRMRCRRAAARRTGV